MELHLPWSADEERTTDIVVRNANRDPVMLIYKSGWDRRSPRFHAEYAVKAVNNHKRLVEQLRALEWCDGLNVASKERDGTCYVAACPSCSGVKPYNNYAHGLTASEVGHKEDCKLAALLKELEN